MGSCGVVVGPERSGVSTRTISGSIDSAPRPDRCLSASFTWSDGPYSAEDGPTPPSPIFPVTLAHELRGNFAGNVPILRICNRGDYRHLERPLVLKYSEILNFSWRVTPSGATALTTSRIGFGNRSCLECWKNCNRSRASSTVLGLPSRRTFPLPCPRPRNILGMAWACTSRS